MVAVLHKRLLSVKLEFFSADLKMLDGRGAAFMTVLVDPSLAKVSAISLPRTPACPLIQVSERLLQDVAK